jgi:HK97 family phage portal protein
MFRAQRDASFTDLPSRVGWRARAGTKKGALAHSAAWACIALRGNLISTLPIDTFRKVPWGQIEVPKPPVLVTPGGEKVEIVEWMYSTQTELDTVGNAFGRITELDGMGLPRRIDLLAREDVSVTSHNGVITYRINGKVVDDPSTIWHEKQYTSAGMAVGLSPLAYAAMDMQAHAAAQEFAAAWFGGGLVPLSHLKYGEAAVPPDQAEAIKLRHKLAIENGDPLVTGKDWEYKPIDVASAQANFITAMQFSDTQICRYFGVPGDLIDANVSGSSITYANITQRNLQFLVMNLGSAIKRREVGLSRLLAQPRFVKLNSEALLRMDPETVSRMLGQQIRDRLVAPSEARELMNRAPFTPEQLAEFKELFPAQYTKTAAERQLDVYTIEEQR